MKDINLLQGQDKPEAREEVKRITGMEISPKTIRNHHLESNLYAVKVSTTRPETGREYPLHINPTTGVLSVWTNSAWKTVTLT